MKFFEHSWNTWSKHRRCQRTFNESAEIRIIDRLAHVMSVIIARRAPFVNFFLPDQLRGFSGSSGPSQSTTFGSFGTVLAATSPGRTEFDFSKSRSASTLGVCLSDSMVSYHLTDLEAEIAGKFEQSWVVGSHHIL